MEPRKKNGNALAIPSTGSEIRTVIALCAAAALTIVLLGLGWSGTAWAQEDPACDVIDLGSVGTEPDGGLTASGIWTTEGCDSRFLTDSDAHTYRFALTEEARIRIDLKSTDGDSSLYLLAEDGRRISDNDDGGAGLDARIERDLGPGTYMVEATTVGGRKRGPADFSLSISTVTGCDPVHIGSLTPGTDLTASGSWTLDTCGSRFVVEHPAHGYLFDLPQDGRVRIDLESENGDAVLSLVSLTEGLISANDDGGAGRNSRIDRYLQAGTYLLEATTYLERDYQPLMADFTLVVHLVDEKARQNTPLIKIEEVHTPERVVAGQPFPVHFRIGNVGDGSLADVRGSALVYVVGPRVFQRSDHISFSGGRWEPGASCHTGALVANAQSVEDKDIEAFEVTIGRPGPSWVFVAVVTEDWSDEEIGFYGLWQNLTVLSGTTFDAVTVGVDGMDYSVEAEADDEGMVTTNVSSVEDAEAAVEPSVKDKAIYTAGVHTQVMDGIFDQPAIADLAVTGKSLPVSIEGASSKALLEQVAAQYANSVAASGLADVLAAGEALNPMSVEELVLGRAKTASEQFISLAAGWNALLESIRNGNALSFDEAHELHAQFAYAERVISPAVEAGEVVEAARSAELGWQDLDVQTMMDDLTEHASCRNTGPDLRSVLEDIGTADVEALVMLDREMRASSPIFGLANDAKLCAVAAADGANSRFLEGLAVADNSEILVALGYPQPSDDQAAPPPPFRLRIIAKLGEDGRVEHGIQLAGGEQILPSKRYLPSSSQAGHWLASSDVEVQGSPIGRIHSRRLADGRVELGFMTAMGDMITPDIRFLREDMPTGVWLRSGEISVASGQSLE